MRDEARDEVGAAAGGGRDQDADRTRRVRLGDGDARCQGQRGKTEQEFTARNECCHRRPPPDKLRAFSGKVDFRFSEENATTQRNLERVSAQDRVNVSGTRRHALVPTLLAAGVTAPVLARAPKAYASWCINRKVDGGLELPPKTVQQRMGHASIAITMDVYGHLFPSGDDGAELAAAEMALLA